MGGVLIDYNPEKTLNEVFDSETAAVLLKEIFRNPIWADKDRGIITPQEIMEQKREAIPPQVFDDANINLGAYGQRNGG